MTDREALKLALEAIEELRYSSSTFKSDKLSAAAITAIKEALAQPAQETKIGCVQHDCDECTARLAQRPWVGLTDDEHCDIWYKESLDWMDYGKAIEARLKEKNT